MASMKLHTEIITLCDYALISREGKLSISGIFDELRVQKFPEVLHGLFLSLRFGVILIHHIS